jgi:Na+/phosphate symporter
MADVIFVAILVAFFTLAALFVRACDRIIGAEAESTDTRTAPTALEEAA